MSARKLQWLMFPMKRKKNLDLSKPLPKSKKLLKLSTLSNLYLDFVHRPQRSQPGILLWEELPQIPFLYLHSLPLLKISSSGPLFHKLSFPCQAIFDETKSGKSAAWLRQYCQKGTNLSEY